MCTHADTQTELIMNKAYLSIDKHTGAFFRELTDSLGQKLPHLHEIVKQQVACVSAP